MNDNCIFCKLANGVFPTNTVYEDEEFRAILDISPAAEGHTLIIPKEHFENALTADPETFGKAMIVATKVAKGVKRAFGCDGINIVQNNGEAAGQTVFHLHIHVIPRWDDDTVNFSYEHLEPSTEALVETAELIKQNI